jgi:hypothetical protein
MKNAKIQIGEDVKGGRPVGTNKALIVYQWRQDHPTGRKVDCIRETGLTKPTVYKWWDIQLLDLRKEPKEQDPRLAFLDEIE